MQFNMMCMKLKEGYFISYDPRVLDASHKIVWYLIKEDEAMQTEIAVRLEAARDIIADKYCELTKIAAASITP